MPIEPDGHAPYAPHSAVIAVIERHREKGLPTPVKTDVVSRIIDSDALAPRVLKALKLYDLIDNEGQPTPEFEGLRKAPSEAEFKDRFAEVLRAAYADVFQYADPATDDPERVEGQFRNYRPPGQRERMVMLFRGLCVYTGIVDEGKWPVREHKPRAPRVRRQGTAKQIVVTEDKELSPPKKPPRNEFTPAPAPPPATGEHPFIQGLLMALPEAGQVWPLSKRKDWTKAALAAFDLMYELPPEDRQEGGDDR